MESTLDIKALRERLGLTQKALAAAVGVQPNTVARWERGELPISGPMMDRLERVANASRSSTVRRSSAVVLDEHHRAILDALNGRLDPEAFEACATDLLRRVWPTLVSVRGGGDDGFDGAVADPTGEPFPLIATTGVKLVDNFTRSLDRARSRGWPITSALFATPRRITPRSRERLFDAARTREVTLRQACDQDWFAQSLYREPEWCKRLLGVTGRPAALSLFPVTQRPLLGDAVLGREREMAWLREQKEDCLLVGEPGSGKTFLLRTLALEGHARFLVDHDRAQIANDLRSLRPAAVIVDDAHVDPMQIAKLDQIRSEVRAQFRIIATSWPGDADTVRSALKVGSTKEMKLDRIDADTMVEIIKSLGIHRPDWLLYLIRKQASGRPGLAATLVHLFRSGNARDVVSGESLVTELNRRIKQIVDNDALRLLAPFALGGDVGVKQVAVSNHLGKPLLDLSSDLAKLGAAGVVRERSEKGITVEPEAMRWIIVKRIFFGGPGALDVESFLKIVETREDALRTLIGARWCGAHVPDLERWLEEASLPGLWSDYASLGAAEARYVLRRHPELIETVAEPTLRNAPETAIRMLLDHMVNERFARTDHLIGVLMSWANGDPDDMGYLLKRRLTLVRETFNWWKRTRNGQTAIHVLCLALMPGVEYHVTDPGIGRKGTLMSVILGDNELRELGSRWLDLIKILRESERVPWSDLLRLVEVWLQPYTGYFPPVRYTHETRDILDEFAGTMLADIAVISSHRPGIQHRIADLARHAGITIELNLDPVFEALEPLKSFDFNDWEHQDQAWSDAIGELARRWEDRTLEDIAAMLSWYEAEARLAGTEGPRFSRRFCNVLAERISDPIAAADALITRDLPSSLVEPFLRKAVAGSLHGWTRLAGQCLAKEEYRRITAEAVLVHRSPPSDLLDTALSVASDMPDLENFMTSLCLGMPDATIREMMRSDTPRIAVAASVSYWQGTNGNIADEFRATWRQAILRSAVGEVERSSDYWLKKILSEDGYLSVDWLISNLSCERHSRYHWEVDDLANAVARSLGIEQRKKVLERLTSADEIRATAGVIERLVGGDLDLYRCLLRSETLKEHHLDPLHRAPDWRKSERRRIYDDRGPLFQSLDDTWREMALAALDHHYSTQQVLDATIGRSWSWSGEESDMWARRRREFEALLNDADDQIVQIGRAGVEYTTERERYALDRETMEAVDGLS